MEASDWTTLTEPGLNFSVNVPSNMRRTELPINEISRMPEGSHLLLKMISWFAQLAVGKCLTWEGGPAGISYQIIVVQGNPLLSGIFAKPNILEEMLSQYFSAGSPEAIRDWKISGYPAKELTFSDRREVYCIAKRTLYQFRILCHPEKFDSATASFFRPYQ